MDLIKKYFYHGKNCEEVFNRQHENYKENYLGEDLFSNFEESFKTYKEFSYKGKSLDIYVNTLFNDFLKKLYKIKGVNHIYEILFDENKLKNYSLISRHLSREVQKNGMEERKIELMGKEIEFEKAIHGLQNLNFIKKDGLKILNNIYKLQKKYFKEVRKIEENLKDSGQGKNKLGFTLHRPSKLFSRLCIEMNEIFVPHFNMSDEMIKLYPQIIFGLSGESKRKPFMTYNDVDKKYLKSGLTRSNRIIETKSFIGLLNLNTDVMDYFYFYLMISFFNDIGYGNNKINKEFLTLFERKGNIDNLEIFQMNHIYQMNQTFSKILNIGFFLFKNKIKIFSKENIKKINDFLIKIQNKNEEEEVLTSKSISDFGQFSNYIFIFILRKLENKDISLTKEYEKVKKNI